MFRVRPRVNLEAVGDWDPMSSTQNRWPVSEDGKERLQDARTTVMKATREERYKPGTSASRLYIPEKWPAEDSRKRGHFELDVSSVNSSEKSRVLGRKKCTREIYPNMEI